MSPQSPLGSIVARMSPEFPLVVEVYLGGAVTGLDTGGAMAGWDQQQWWLGRVAVACGSKQSPQSPLGSTDLR
jgi:hypothetical protein